MNDVPASNNAEEGNGSHRKRLPKKANRNRQNEIRCELRYNGETNSASQTDQSGIEFTFEIREVTGPEGRRLTLAQGRALRRALEWAAAYAQQTHGETSDSGEEKPRAA
jgi:hypothetical protein